MAQQPLEEPDYQQGGRSLFSEIILGTVVLLGPVILALALLPLDSWFGGNTDVATAAGNTTGSARATRAPLPASTPSPTPATVPTPEATATPVPTPTPEAKITRTDPVGPPELNIIVTERVEPQTPGPAITVVLPPGAETAFRELEGESAEDGAE